MADPNIFNTTLITGNTAVQNVTTVLTAVVSNAAASGRVYRVNTLMVSNVDAVNAADITVDVFRSSIAYRLASTITVPPDASLVVISKENSIYLQEGDSLRCAASANNDLMAVCSFENIGI
jgi:hypothetical protein